MATPFMVIEHRSNVSQIGLEGIPLHDVTPAHVRYQITVIADAHVVLRLLGARARPQRQARQADRQGPLRLDRAMLAPPVAPPDDDGSVNRLRLALLLALGMTMVVDGADRGGAGDRRAGAAAVARSQEVRQGSVRLGRDRHARVPRTRRQVRRRRASPSACASATTCSAGSTCRRTSSAPAPTRRLPPPTSASRSRPTSTPARCASSCRSTASSCSPRAARRWRRSRPTCSSRSASPTARNFTFAVIGGGGLDYHTLNRHFSVGLGADYVWLSTFTGGHALSFDVYLRYTR